MIPQEKIDEIRQSIDIVDIVSDYVRLQSSGHNYKALSPFTAEKTPSFVVSPDKQIYKCFSSGKGGNVFTFLMEMEKISFPEAVEAVARRAGIDISGYRRSSPQPGAAENRHYDTLKWAGRLFNRLLFAEEGRQALEYALNDRGLSRKIITSFGLGYAPDQWDRLKKEAARSSIPAEELSATGLLYHNPRKNTTYDYFRNRIMFPIFSVGGNVVGFGGRTLSNDKKAPKYLNSPDSAVFDKSRVLYGLHAAKDAIRKQGEAVLVEGYMDVLALHQAGITTAVASCGTALTRHQAALLNRYCSQVLFLYDADDAGQKSMLSGIGILLAGGLTPWIATLPAGDDPDSFVRQNGREAFETYLSTSRQSFIDFQISYQESKGMMNSADGKSQAVREILSTVNLVRDPVQQEIYLREIEQKLNLSLAVLRDMLHDIGQRNRSRSSGEAKPSPTVTATPGEPSITVLEKTFLKALMESADYGHEVLDFAASHAELLVLPTPAAADLLHHILQYYRHASAHDNSLPDISAAIGSIDSEQARDLASGLLIDTPLSQHWQESFDEHQQKARRCLTAFLDSFRHLILQNYRDRKQELISKLHKVTDIEEEKQLSADLNQLLKDEQTTESDVNAMISAILSGNS
ncbi:DNA primase [Prosthecochloris sp. ZM_2]|uniref:DNA primase n=1 Tax=Prosthecochloris sp. ZM_2 TaxID=2045206 RepID=UPI000DF732D5|nr:DNA primase [Prosthecochloris sp. ZM_2]RNA64466.1 DNA primase [Prosthecochloris sp. ZM_2]